MPVCVCVFVHVHSFIHIHMQQYIDFDWCNTPQQSPYSLVDPGATIHAQHAPTRQAKIAKLFRKL